MWCWNSKGSWKKLILMLLSWHVTSIMIMLCPKTYAVHNVQLHQSYWLKRTRIANTCWMLYVKNMVFNDQSMSQCIGLWFFFMETKAKYGTSDQYPKITTKVHESITHDHFASNNMLIEVLKPVADLTGNTKSPSIILAHILLKRLKLYMKLINLKNITNSLTQKLFIDHAIKWFNVQVTQYLNDTVYAISMYLWPE